MRTATTVSATFDGSEAAERAVRALLDQSVPRERIRVFLPDDHAPTDGTDTVGRELSVNQVNLVFRLSMIGGALGTVLGLVALTLVVSHVWPDPGVGFAAETWLAVVQGGALGLLLGWITGVIIGLGMWTVEIGFPKGAERMQVRVEVEPFVKRVEAVRETLVQLGGKLSAD